MTMQLIVQQGQGTAQALRLERGLLAIGRGQDCDLVLQDTQVSRRHAELRRYGGQWFLVDLGSTNGTFVDGARLRPDEAYPLPPGVPVQIGDTRFFLEKETLPSPDSLPEPPAQELLREGEIPVPHLCGGQNRLAWLPRLVVAIGSAILIVGTLLDWIRVEVSTGTAPVLRLPLLGGALDKSYNGLDSEQAWLFIGVALLALGLLLADIMARKRGSGLAAGVGQALAGVVAVSVAAASFYRYYQIGTKQILGVSLVEVLTQYLDDQIHISIQFGVYLVAIGLVALILGGLLRLLVAAREPA
ncbi:MAG: FHA domain-containing protein [Anaerolineae bacterium]|nr:FHA domain-containing protein [Anaerolineae bacterium]